MSDVALRVFWEGKQKDQEFKDIVGYMRPYFKKPS